MKRQMIQIDEALCNGCGLCVDACHEGAIGMTDGKAKLLRDDYCDGLGDCLPICPTGAIRFEEREAVAYDALAVQAAQASTTTLACGCPGHQAKAFVRKPLEESPTQQQASALRQWPVQIQLVPTHAPYWQDAQLLVAADCAAYAYANFHRAFMQDKITLIACPKLDAVDYSEKLGVIFRENSIQSVTVVRMEVPCCGGLEHAVKSALQVCGKDIPCHVATLTTDGRILER